MTSNIGSQFILDSAGNDWAVVETQVMQQLRSHFRPEFLNRVDDVVVFKPLGEQDIARIIDLQIVRLEKLLAERKLVLEVTDEAKKFVAHEGYEPAFGARPLKRALQRLVQDPLAMAVLEGRFSDGDKVRVTLKDGAIAFDKGA
jgi:ATP-dependent Clp protease ATP-binding subunit ClpB